MKGMDFKTVSITCMEQSVDIQNHAVAASYSTHDYSEGKYAFAEKREPQYVGK